MKILRETLVVVVTFKQTLSNTKVFKYFDL